MSCGPAPEPRFESVGECPENIEGHEFERDACEGGVYTCRHCGDTGYPAPRGDA